jgi:hypothetical protein
MSSSTSTEYKYQSSFDKVGDEGFVTGIESGVKCAINLSRAHPEVLF